MAATELSLPAPRAPRLPAGLGRVTLQAYAAFWGLTLGSALIVRVGWSTRRAPTQQLLNPPPHFGHILWLAAHNIPLAAWPLLLGVASAQKLRVTRRAADTLLVVCMIVNTAPTGAVIGTYGTAPFSHIIQLPLEWAGLALGAGSWLVQRRRTLSTRERLVWLALIVGVLLCAAVLETVAVPHR
jgi:hypothetical protein